MKIDTDEIPEIAYADTQRLIRAMGKILKNYLNNGTTKLGHKSRRLVCYRALNLIHEKEFYAANKRFNELIRKIEDKEC